MKNNNKKYKINMKGLLLGLGGAVSVIAPVATLVACGGSNSSTKKLDPSLAGTKIDTSHIADLPQGIHAYTQADLMADAIKFNDGNTGWNWGAAYHTLSSTVSFIKGMSETLGWTKSDYVAKQHLTYIDDAAALAKSTPAATDPAAQSSIKALELMHFAGPLNDVQKTQAYFENGDDGTFNAMGYFNVAVDNVTKYEYPSTGVHVFTIGADTFTTNLKRWFSYADINNPGSIKLNLNDTDHKINREILIKDAFDKFPILPEEQLKNEIAPFAKALFEKFLTIANGKIASEIFGSATIDQETVDQINFLVSHFTVTDANGHKTFKIDDQEINNAMVKLNNGSTHWLAVKAAYLGFDKSLVSEGYETYNSFNRSQMGAHWNPNTNIKGFKDMNEITEMADWAGEVKTVRPNNGGQAVFYASKDLHDLDIANNYTAERTQQIASLIASADGQKYLAGVTTTGLSLGELQRRIAIEKYVETVKAPTDLAGVDKNTMSLQQIKNLVEWNRLKSQHMDLITAYIADPAHIIAQADIEAHRDEIRTGIAYADYMAKVQKNVSAVEAKLNTMASTIAVNPINGAKPVFDPNSQAIKALKLDGSTTEPRMVKPIDLENVPALKQFATEFAKLDSQRFEPFNNSIGSLVASPSYSTAGAIGYYINQKSWDANTGTLVLEAIARIVYKDINGQTAVFIKTKEITLTGYMTQVEIDAAKVAADQKAAADWAKYLADNVNYLQGVKVDELSHVQVHAIVDWNKHLETEKANLGTTLVFATKLPTQAEKDAINATINDNKNWTAYLTKHDATIKAIGNLDITNHVATKDAVEWFEMNRDHKAEMDAAAIKLGTTIATATDANKAAIIAEAKKALEVDLSGLQAFIDNWHTQGKFILNFKDSDTTTDYKFPGEKLLASSVVTSNQAVYSEFKQELLRLIGLKHQTYATDARFFIFHSATADTISVTLKFDTKSTDGQVHHNSVDLTLYRH